MDNQAINPHDPAYDGKDQNSGAVSAHEVAKIEATEQVESSGKKKGKKQEAEKPQE